MKNARKARLTVKRVEAALAACAGIRVAAAQQLGVARSTLYRFFDQHPRLAAFAAEIEEEIKDIAESKVLQLIRAGDPPTVRWYLELKAKDRGYVRRVETVGPNGGPIPVTHKPDLSQHSDEELEILLRGAERREKQGGRLKAA